MAVGIVKSHYGHVKSSLLKLFEIIEYSPSKNKVFIKPNIVGPHPRETGVITDPSVIAALIEIFIDKGCEVVVGEGSSVAQDTDFSAKKSGYTDMLNSYGIDFINLNNAPRRNVEWKYGTIKLPEIVFTHEYIDVAKMKTHLTTKVTLGMKNQKGILLPEDKRNFHLKYNLPDAIMELNKVVSPALTIIDGITALEGNGPGRAGKPVDFGVLIAGNDVVETDNAAIKLMGFVPGEIEYIPVINNIDLRGEAIDNLKRNFLRAEENQVHLGKLCFHSMRACTGCIELFAAGFGMADKSKFTEPVDVYAGRDVAVCSAHNVVCFGNCAKKYAEKNGLPFIPGCPPKPPAVSTIPDLIHQHK
jgi:uncharacterized protein (DUF362 family)